MTKSTVLLKIIPLLIVAAATLPLAADAGRERVVFVCAHPDDLAGCSGTALLLAEKFDVRVIDFTKGEGGLGGVPGWLHGEDAHGGGARRVRDAWQ